MILKVSFNKIHSVMPWFCQSSANNFALAAKPWREIQTSRTTPKILHSYISSCKKIPLLRPKTLLLKNIFLWRSLGKVFCYRLLFSMKCFELQESTDSSFTATCANLPKTSLDCPSTFDFLSVPRFTLNSTQKFLSSVFWYSCHLLSDSSGPLKEPQHT